MRSLYLKHLFIKWLTATSVCLGTGASLINLSYTVKDNGVMVNLDYTEPINSDDIIVWKSDRQWIYLSLFGVKAPKNKIPLKKLEWPVKKIVLDEFNESTQLAILIGKPILGYDILNSKTSSGTVLFIRTKLKESEIANFKRHINNNGTPVYDLVQSSDSHEDTTSFEIAFNEARLELGSNSIFKYKEKLYTTNHQDEDSSKITPGLMSAELITEAENTPEIINVNSATSGTSNQKVGGADLVSQDKSGRDDTHLYSYINQSEKLYTTNHQDEDSSKITPGLMSAELITEAENTPEIINVNSATSGTSNQKVGGADLVSQDKSGRDDTHLYSYINQSEILYEPHGQKERWYSKLFKKIRNQINYNKKRMNGSAYLNSDKFNDLYLLQRNGPQYYNYAYEKPLPIYPEWIEINDIEAGLFPASYQEQYNPLLVSEEIMSESEPYAISSNWIDISLGERPFKGEYPNPDKYFSGQVSVSKYFPKGIPNDTLAQQNWDKLEPRELSLVSAGISITANIDGVLIYIDGILVGETPLREPIDITPGWHQVYGLTPSFAKAVNEFSTEYLYNDPIIRNNQMFGSRAVYVDPNDVSVVDFKLEKIGNAKKYLNKTKGDIIIGIPVIMALLGIMSWGIM